MVVLALVGDSDVSGGLYPQGGNGGPGAEPAPRLRTTAEKFRFGQWGSVCATNYTPFFEDAVSIVDTSRDQLDAPG